MQITPYGTMNILSNKTMQITLSGYNFTYICDLIPENINGKAIPHSPQSKYVNPKKLSLHCAGDGDFCKFSLQNGVPTTSGVYALVVQNQIIYIGETQNLKQRFNNGYGNISPRNCYQGGQITNCKINKVVMDCFNKGTPVELYFLDIANHKEIEKILITAFSPI